MAIDRILSPQQELFLASYTDPNSPTFSNAYQSAKKAGYADTYAENILNILPEWLLSSIEDMAVLRKAEKNLQKALDIDVKDEKLGGRAIDVSKWLAERLSKNKYGNRIDITSGNKPIQNTKPIKEMSDEEINIYLKDKLNGSPTK